MSTSASFTGAMGALLLYIFLLTAIIILLARPQEVKLAIAIHVALFSAFIFLLIRRKLQLLDVTIFLWGGLAITAMLGVALNSVS